MAVSNSSPFQIRVRQVEFQDVRIFEIGAGELVAFTALEIPGTLLEVRFDVQIALGCFAVVPDAKRLALLHLVAARVSARSGVLTWWHGPGPYLRIDGCDDGFSRCIRTACQ